MADVPIDCEFPVWGLMPKTETGVVSFLTKYPEYDGRNTVIAILDSGVDPAADGLKVTSLGETKVIERFDCSGAGDVDTSTVVTKDTNGFIKGITGRKLTIPESWKNPSGEWRVGVLYPYSIYPQKLKERIQEYRKEHLWEVRQKPAFAKANKDLQDFESKNPTSSTLSLEDKQWKEELDSRVDVLTLADKKYSDIGPTYDCVLFHDGDTWRACIDISEIGDLKSGPCLGEYSKTHEHTHMTPIDEMTISINVHDNGDILEVVGMCSTHGTHVAAIAAGSFADEPHKNGVAPGAKIVSLTIGDSRLGSMETGSALVRACIKLMELSSLYSIDVINMSYGEHAHWAHTGRLGKIMHQVINRYHIPWVVSAGNQGPALGTVGAPPDIHQTAHIGVGAYIPPSCVLSSYSSRAVVSGSSFPWSSRGPSLSGDLQPTIAAPGAAMAPVARFVLKNAQLMNGTSMAAPHVAGAVAILISGMKRLNLKYSPYSMKRALANSATYLNHVEPWAQGNGLLNVEKAFTLLSSYSDSVERDVNFSIQCPDQTKGILFTTKEKCSTKEFNVTINTQHLEDYKDEEDLGVIQKQLEFRVFLSLVSRSEWVSAPKHADLSSGSKVLQIKVDATTLPPGSHFTSVDAYDISCVEKGPLFRIPITVIQPEPVELSCSSGPMFSQVDISFSPSTLKRHFIRVPTTASWGIFKMQSKGDGTSTNERFLIHIVQNIPKKSCRSHETQKMITLTKEAPYILPFPLVGGAVVQLVIVRYWSCFSAGQVSYSVSLRGVGHGHSLRLIGHSANVSTLTLNSLRHEDIQPSLTLKHNEQIIRPSESKLLPMTSRDVIPIERQIYQLINTYNFHLTKTTEVTPQISLLCDMLYESEFESQMWMLYNNNKQLMAVGDAYPSKYSVKIEKGEYVVRVNIRHEKKSYLESLWDLPLVLSHKLTQNIVLDVYADYDQAITGGKKITSCNVPSGNPLPVYVAPVPSDKLSRASASLGHILTGSAIWCRDELGRKVDVQELKYIVCEPPKKNNKDKEKKTEEFPDALKDFYTNWIVKLEGEKLDQVYEELIQKYPNYLGAHIAYIHALECPSDAAKLPHVKPSEVNGASSDKIITLADKVINGIDQDKLLAYLGMKNDTRTDAPKIKSEFDRQRTHLIEALCAKGVALCRVNGSGDKSTQLMDNYQTLMKYTDFNDSKAIQYGVWHYFTLKHWGKAIKLLNRMLEDRPSKEIELRLVQAYEQLQWKHLTNLTMRAMPARYPSTYRPF